MVCSIILYQMRYLGTLTVGQHATIPLLSLAEMFFRIVVLQLCNLVVCRPRSSPNTPLTVPPAAARDVDASLCHLNSNVMPPTVDPARCEAQGDVSLVPVILLFMSQLVTGIGATAYYTLGLTYLDDSVDKKQSPVMFGG